MHWHIVHCFILCDLKATQINKQLNLIQKLMLYVFKLNHNAMEATKNICSVKGESTVDHSIVTRWFKKFCLDCKVNQKLWISEAMFQNTEPNLEIIRWAQHLTIQRSSWLWQKASGAAELCLMLPKYYKAFDSH